MDLIPIIIQFVIAFGLLLFFHEFGHFIAARLFKIEVEEFGFGLPPRLVKLFTWKGTDITLNWIPFGAFVRPKGENDPEVEGGMGAANSWVKLAVLVAGPLMNIAVGFILLVALYGYVGVPDPTIVQIVQVAPASPAQQAGVLPGDTVKQVNQQTVNGYEVLQSTIKANLGQQITLVVQRGKENYTYQIVPRANPPQGQGALGIQLDYGLKTVSWTQSIPQAFQGVYEQGRQFVMLPVQLIEGTIAPDQARLVGIVGIFGIYRDASQMDTEASATPVTRPPLFRLSFFIAITIALGLTNLLPIPGLDGGRILLTLPELIFHRRVPSQYENMVNGIGLLLLLGLMAIITVSDIIHLVKPN
jgi:regulator of sigma E protease